MLELCLNFKECQPIYAYKRHTYKECSPRLTIFETAYVSELSDIHASVQYSFHI